MLFRHYTTLDRVIRTIKQKGWSFRHAYIKTLRKLPYSEARIRDRWYEITDTRHDWMDRAETLASRLMTSFRKRKEREMQQDKIALREQLDDHFAYHRSIPRRDNTAQTCTNLRSVVPTR
jgi:hypothetical protein